MKLGDSLVVSSSRAMRAVPDGRWWALITEEALTHGLPPEQPRFPSVGEAYQAYRNFVLGNRR